jgi:choline dehydrogenase-like flavoprotein
MTTRLKEVDAVMVGMGWTGSIMAGELTKAGLQVVGLERGPDIKPAKISPCRTCATNCATCSGSTRFKTRRWRR